MQQEGIDFHNTFSPVVNWSTVRLIIIMADMAGRESRQIDCVLAFSKAQLIVMFIFIYQQVFMLMVKTKMKHIF